MIKIMHAHTRKIEASAAIFGITGALLLAIPGVHPALGFLAFLASSLEWAVFAALFKHWRMFGQHCCFLLINLIGLWNWWLGPLLLG